MSREANLGAIESISLRRYHTALDADPSASLIMFPRVSLNTCIFFIQNASPRNLFLISSCKILVDDVPPAKGVVRMTVSSGRLGNHRICISMPTYHTRRVSRNMILRVSIGPFHRATTKKILQNKASRKSMVSIYYLAKYLFVEQKISFLTSRCC